MPNLWTQTSQKIYEAFYGPRTIDVDFNMKVDEIKACERSLQGVRNIIANFNRQTGGIKSMCKDVYTQLSLAYSEQSQYFGTITEISQVHQELERIYDKMIEIVQMLHSQTLDWERNFDDVKKNFALREENRRTYDHYDQKLEKLVKSRQDKVMRGGVENQKEIEAFDRNDIKYKQATDAFIKQSLFTYNQMYELLEFRYKLLNPVVTAFINEERKFFAAANDLFKRFDNIQGKFQSLERQLKKSDARDYDPRKYIRGHQLLNGVNLDELRKKNIIKKDKYSYEDYLQGKGQAQNVNTSVNQNNNLGNVINTYSNSSNNNNKNLSDVNKFSYEAYLMSKGQSTGNNIKQSVNQEQSIDSFYSPNFGSNVSQDKPKDINYLNFELNSNKPDDMKRTTIIPQDDFSTLKTEQQVDNPYSFLNLDTNTQRNFSLNPNMNNRSQMPMNNFNQPRMGSFSQMAQGQNQNRGGNYPTYGDINNRGGNNLEFPR